jgi:hypothetical protein
MGQTQISGRDRAASLELTLELRFVRRRRDARAPSAFRGEVGIASARLSGLSMAAGLG